MSVVGNLNFYECIECFRFIQSTQIHVTATVLNTVYRLDSIVLSNLILWYIWFSPGYPGQKFSVGMYDVWTSSAKQITGAESLLSMHTVILYQWMTEAAFSYLAEAVGRRLKRIPKPNVELFKIGIYLSFMWKSR